MRSDLARRASYAASDFWNDERTGGAYDASCWEILPDLNIAFVPVLPVKNEFQKFQSQVPSVTPDTIPSTGDNFERKEQCRVILPFTAFISCKDARSLSRIQDPFCIMSRYIAWHVEDVWENGSGGNFSRERKIKYGVSRTQSEEMTHSAGVEVSATAGIGLVESSIKLNYQFTDTNSRSFTEYTEQEVTQKFEVPPKHVTVLFSKHVWLKVTRGDGSEELSQIEMAANADVHFSGCSL